VITITSTSATRPTGSSIPYSVSKAALNHLTALLAKALGPEIRVNAVAPGLIDTPWSADWHQAHERVRREAALRRSGTPEDVAAACLLLSRTAYATGTVVTVDGGLSLM
jgi:ketoreductase RED2